MKQRTLSLAVALSMTLAAAGTPIRADEESSARQPVHWSYQGVQQPAVPAVSNARWVRTPIDAFVLQQLEAKGLQPSPDADHATLIRRAYLDVLGFIPSPEEVDAFVNDTAPDAYERLIETLLASPHYGERQARHWLDLARYADSTGFQNDGDRRNMWRYRDYVIDSFNADKPYSRFIQEQIAGDELFPGDESALVATGFLAQYPDNDNSRDMVQRRYQIITDITDTVGKAVLGQTVGCARCHDHKFDAISQKEYFGLQAFFANLSAVEVPVAQQGDVEARYLQQQAAWEDATKDIRAQMKAIIDADYDNALKYHKERYLTDTRASLFKDESEWNALDRWVNHRLEEVTGQNQLLALFEDRAVSTDPEFHSEWHKEKLDEYRALQDELKKFDHLKPSVELGSAAITAMNELGHADAPPTYVYAAGDHEKPLDEVQPGFPAAIVASKPAIQPLGFSSGRRAALAQWLTSADQPLTPRVYVNRVWDQYFGRGIVETVSDFGKAGTPPSHPELLDYLASRFVEQGWSVKQLHREILLSSVYRQASEQRDDLLAGDPENRLLGRFPHRRLEAEQIRDSLLAASGKLVTTVGGPSVLPPLPSTARNGGDQYGNMWRASKDDTLQNRRSLYIFTRRSLPYPLLEVFNMASPQEAHSKREITTTPLQALTLFNSEIIFDWSRALAGRVINEAKGGEEAQLDRLYEILFAREPEADEKSALLGFLDEQERIITERAGSAGSALALPAGAEYGQLNVARAAAFVDLVHAVVNSNEFIYRF